MPEGHITFRLAADLTQAFQGQPVAVSSPQGKFADAELLSGLEFFRATSFGKQLFIEFETAQIVQVHLGLYGKFAVVNTSPSAPVGQVRLRIATAAAYADLRGAMVCRIVTAQQQAAVVAKLGPDPLDPGADAAKFISRVQRSGRSIAELLMDQNISAGVGNVFRAEVLYRQQLAPLIPGNQLSSNQLKNIWDDLVRLMRLATQTGRIDTVRPAHTPEAMDRPPRVDDHGGEVYVYRRKDQNCLVCDTSIQTQVLAGRNLFWCPKCQQ